MSSSNLTTLLRTTTKKIVCIGKNYDAHITELAHLSPKVWDKTKEKDPVLFLKPSTSFAFPGQPMILPKKVKGEVHHEVELGVVIKETAKNVDLENDDDVIERFVEGYFCGIDMTARDEQTEAKNKGMPWAVAKGYDTFLPISEAFESNDDWREFELYLDVNGERRQKSPAGVMLHSIPDLIRYCSSVMTLERGDVIITGTPAGVGPVFDGDVMRAGIKGKCHMEVAVVKEDG